MLSFLEQPSIVWQKRGGVSTMCHTISIATMGTLIYLSPLFQHAHQCHYQWSQYPFPFIINQFYNTFIETAFFIIIKAWLRCISWHSATVLLAACNRTVINLSTKHLISKHFFNPFLCNKDFNSTISIIIIINAKDFVLFFFPVIVPVHAPYYGFKFSTSPDWSR